MSGSLQRCAVLGGDKFSFPLCSHLPSLVAVLDLCPAEVKLLWAHAFVFGTSVFRCSKVTCDFMSKTLIEHSHVLFYMLSVNLIWKKYSVCFNILSLMNSHVFQGLKNFRGY